MTLIELSPRPTSHVPCHARGLAWGFSSLVLAWPRGPRNSSGSRSPGFALSLSRRAVVRRGAARLQAETLCPRLLSLTNEKTVPLFD